MKYEDKKSRKVIDWERACVSQTPTQESKQPSTTPEDISDLQNLPFDPAERVLEIVEEQRLEAQQLSEETAKKE